METRSILLVVCALAIVAMGFRRTRDPERLLVFRLGRVHRLAGPGITWLIPVLDQSWRVNLDRAVPDWRSMADDELISRLIEYGKQPASPAP